ncbi:MAG TPA: hypothetical protein VL947_10310, partial [Cytophagales bacterium]|nr:hypothetical protein [Cytophagales bacterium]
LILGKGGAALAVQAALADLHIAFTYVSRGQHPNAYAYEDLDAGTIAAHRLVVNTTPLGMYPNITESPNIPYQYLSELHFVYDLVYNPEVTMFMQRAAAAGAKTTNGHQMLILQAEKAWEIWKS